jgi:hypothetical protein
MHTTDSFVAVNSEWRYTIQIAPKPLRFDPQPNNLWLAHTQDEEFRILTPEATVKMLNEALEKDLVVLAVHQATSKVLAFSNQLMPHQAPALRVEL